MGSLKAVQTIARVFKVILSVLIVIGFIATCATAVAYTATFINPDFEFNLFGEQVFGFVSIEGDVVLSDLRVDLIILFIASFAECLVMWWTLKYLNYEIAEGSPFTSTGANMLLKVGIKSLVVTLIASAACGFISYFWDVTLLIEDFGSALMGASHILLSFVFKYGAEIRAKAQSEMGKLGE